MGTVAPDLLVEARLRSALNSVSQNPVVLDDALARFDSRGREQVRSFFRGRKVPVLSGWPNQAQQVPCVTVQLRPSQELTELQSINPTMMYPQEDAMVMMYSAFFQSVVVCTCYGNNQSEATILALVVKWILMVMRQQLEIEGLMEQSLAVSDFEPIPNMFDQNTQWFLRSVNLTCVHEDNWNVAQGPLIADILVSPYDDRVDE